MKAWRIPSGFDVMGGLGLVSEAQLIGDIDDSDR